jgi:hypothetical protein
MDNLSSLPVVYPRRFYVLDADVEEHTFELFVIDPKAKKEPVFEIQIH